MNGFLALLGLGIDAAPAVKGSKQFEAAASGAAKAGEKAANAAEKQDKAYRKAAGGSKAFSDALTTLRNAVVAVALARLIGDTIRAGAAFESLRARLVTIEGSTTAAGSAFKRLQEFAAKTPFELSKATEAYIQLKARGIDPTLARMTALGDIAASFGRDITDIAAAVGGAVTGEFESLKSFGIVARTEANAIAFTYDGVTTKVGKNTEAIVGYLQSLGETKFLGGADRLAQTLDGRLSTLRDSWRGLQAAIVGNNEAIGISNEAIGISVQWISKQIDALAENIPVIASTFYLTFGQVLEGAYNLRSKIAGVFASIVEVAAKMAIFPGQADRRREAEELARDLRQMQVDFRETGEALREVYGEKSEAALAGFGKAAESAAKSLSKVPPPDGDTRKVENFASALSQLAAQNIKLSESIVDQAFAAQRASLNETLDLLAKRSLEGFRAVESAEAEADHEEMLVAKRREGAAALREYLVEYETMRRASEAGITGANAGELARIDEIRAAVQRMFTAGDDQAALDKQERAAQASANIVLDAYNGAADQIAANIAGMFGEILRGGEVTWGDLFGSMLDAAISAFEQIVREWIAAKLKMEAAGVAVDGGGGGGGINAGGLGSAASGSGASAASLGIAAVFVAAAYAWYNDRQHDYELMTSAILDLEDAMQSVADQIGESISAGGRVEVRKDGDRFRIRSGTDSGAAEYKYFDEYADAIAGATLDRLRQLLDQGRLDHIGDQAKAVVGKITDEIIQLGDRGLEWLQRGLSLATQLDNLGKSEMELSLQNLRYEYEENTRLAAEYGISLQKVGDLYRSQLGDLEDSLRSRIDQYLPGYDPVGAEFDSIRADNEALKAEYERLRAGLQEQIDQVLKTIQRLNEGFPEGSAGSGPGSPFAQADAYMDALMELIQRGAGLQGTGGIMGGEILGYMDGLLNELNSLGNVAAGGGGIKPDDVERIRQQRELLADLMGQLGLLGEGLSDEEIAAAEREARRRQNRGNRAAERAAFEDSMRTIIDSGLPDLVRELKATQDQIAEVASEAARLGADGSLAAEAIAALNVQLASQAQEAYLSLAERMAEAAGDEETLRDLAELRWDLERSQMLLQINMLEEMGFLQADQVARLRALYDNLPVDLPGENTPERDIAAEVMSALGIDLDGLVSRFEALRSAATVVDNLANGIKILIPGVAELEAKIAALDDEARQFVGDSLFLQFGDQLLAFVDRYYADTAEGEALRVALEQVRFQLEIANLNAQFQMLQALGVLTQQQIAIIEGALGFINDPANWPDFTIPNTGGGGGYYDSGSNAADERARDLERFFEALERWEQIGLSDARRELMGIAEEFADLRAEAIRLGQPLSRVNAAFELAMEDFWDRMLSPYEDNGQDANQRLADLNAHFQELIDLAGEYGGDLERILAAQQQAVADLWEEILGPLRDYQSQLAGSTLGTATPEERLLAAQAEFERLTQLALSGDVNAIQQLPAAIEALLNEAQGYYGTGAAYQALYSSIQAIIEQILGLGGLGGAGEVGGGGSYDNGPRGDSLPGGVRPRTALSNVSSFATGLPLVPRFQDSQSADRDETIRLLKEQLEEQRRINREQARMMTEMLAESKRSREAIEEMANELRVTSQATRRTNTVLEDDVRTRTNRRSSAA